MEENLKKLKDNIMYTLENNNISNKFKIIKTEIGLFVVPKEKELRNILKFKEIKFSIISRKNPIYIIYPDTIKYNKKKYITHKELLNEILKIKAENNKLENFDLNFEKKLIFGTYNVENQKIEFISINNNSNNNIKENQKIKDNIKKILDKKVEKEIFKKNKKTNIIPKINIKHCKKP